MEREGDPHSAPGKPPEHVAFGQQDLHTPTLGMSNTSLLKGLSLFKEEKMPTGLAAVWERCYLNEQRTF